MSKREKMQQKDDDDLVVNSKEIELYETIHNQNDELTVNRIEDILKEEPIYLDDNSIDDMCDRNKDFYEKTSQKIFKTVMKEEQEKLNELLEATYYPDKKEEEISDIVLLKEYLNFIN
jgi:hypothetical protein